MPLVMHLLDEWGDIQFLFPNFPWIWFQWEKLHNNLSIGFMTWMCHFVDASWVSGTWSAGHGGWWFHVRSFERHVFVGVIGWACRFIDIAFGQIYTCLPRLLLGASWGDSGEC